LFWINTDKTPYISVPNNIPLDEMNPQLTTLNGRALHFAKKSLLPEFEELIQAMMI